MSVLQRLPSVFRGAVYVPIRAEHTAIALFGRQYGTTMGALVEELSGVTGHFLFPAIVTAGTGYGRLGTDFQSHPHLMFLISTHFGR